jgi:acetyl-CoA carboxylase carboxyl transferase subunit beta
MAKYVTVQVTRKEPTAPVEAVERCKKCSQPLSAAELEQALRVCPHCGYHYPLSAPARIAQLADPGSTRPVGEELRPADPLEFFDTRPYPERVSEAQAETGMSEAFSALLCRSAGRPVALGILDFRFMGGSMGSVVGERFYRLVQAALEVRAPLVVVAASGGARMQEGLFSLMQMAKTVVAIQMLREARLPYITVLTHPTTGGVLASFCTVADVIMAEPKATIRFAGARVIEQTTREKLPPGYDLSEAILSYGQLDMIVERRELKDTLARTLNLLLGEVPADGVSSPEVPDGA